MKYWLFNTNETNGPNAYRRMFDRNVAAIWGYKSGPRKLEGALEGDTILAYVNNQGIRAVGQISNRFVTAGSGIFLDAHGHQQPAEYHLKVEWEIVLPRERAFSFAAARAQGLELPVRCSFAKLKDSQRVEQIIQLIYS